MTSRTTFRIYIPCVIVLTALLALMPSLGNAAEQAATVISVSPGVVSHYKGEVTTLKVKMKVPVGATVISGATGRAQLMFPDTTTVSIVPDAEITLAEYVDDPSKESIILNVEQGTARVITGEVSRRKPSAMVVNTPKSSVGVHGTMVTIVVSGDTTQVYLTETSGLGVSVTNRSTGEQKKMVKPGMLIEVTPRGMEERPGTLDEVRKMTVDLHTAPRITDDERRVPVGVASITPQGELSPTGAYDAGMMPMSPMPNLDGLNENLLVGHYEGSGASPYSSTIYFDVNAQAHISNAFFDIGGPAGGGADYTGRNGSGNINAGGSFSVNNFTMDAPNAAATATLNGQFQSSSGGSYNLNVTDSRGPIEIDSSGSFSKQ